MSKSLYDLTNGLMPEEAREVLPELITKVLQRLDEAASYFRKHGGLPTYNRIVSELKKEQKIAADPKFDYSECAKRVDALSAEFFSHSLTQTWKQEQENSSKDRAERAAASASALDVYASYTYYLNQGGRTYLLTDHEAKSKAFPGRHFKHLYSLLPSAAAKEEAANIPYYVPGPRGDDKRVNVCQAYIDSENRRDLSGITFDPSTTERIVRDEFNIWQGWQDWGPVVPNADEPFWRLVRERICGGNPEYFEFVQKWLAHLVQRPWERPLCALGIKGGQGTGKSSFTKIIGGLMHSRHNNQNVTMSNLTGDAQGKDLEGVLFAYVDEATFGGDLSKSGAIKKAITGEFERINEKFVPAYNVPTYKRIVFTSNEEYYYHADADDRRLLPLEIPEHLGQVSTEHSQELFDGEQFRPEVQAAVLATLRSIDIQGWYPHRALKALTITTGAGLMERSMTPLQQWMKESINNKTFQYRDREGDIVSIYDDTITVRELQDCYQLFCLDDSFNKNRQVSLSSHSVKAELRKYFGADAKTVTRNGVGARRYHIDWAVMRKNFAASFKWKIDWDHTEDQVLFKTKSNNVVPLMPLEDPPKGNKARLNSLAAKFASIKSD